VSGAQAKVAAVHITSHDNACRALIATSDVRVGSWSATTQSELYKQHASSMSSGVTCARLLA
jgi:hypothetical protein